MRYVICGTKRGITGPCLYVSRKGCTTYDATKAAVIRTLVEAQAEIAYWRRNQFAAAGFGPISWRIEQLPAGPLAKAVLRAVEVESELCAS